MKRRKNRWSLALRYILLLLGGAVSVMPMIYMLSTSLRPNGALYEFPPHFFPKLSEITLENYRYIFAQEKFYLNFINSVIVAIITIVLAAIIASALAYCLARFEFPGKKLLFALVIGMMDNNCFIVADGRGHDAHHPAVSARVVFRHHEQPRGAYPVLCRVGHPVFHVYDQKLHREHPARV